MWVRHIFSSWSEGLQGYEEVYLPVTFKMCIGICLGDVTVKRKTIHNKYSLVINNSALNYEHVVQLSQALTYPYAPTHTTHTDKPKNFSTDASNLQSKHTLE